MGLNGSWTVVLRHPNFLKNRNTSMLYGRVISKKRYKLLNSLK